MTHHTAKRRSYRRRNRHVYVTTIRGDHSPEAIALVVTNIALSGAQREVEARADYQARLARERALEAPQWQTASEGAGNA
ncbi:hypothetical protein BOH66_08370 [Microbacterium aurum]|uniref:Uncharacterized protein n=1 Tax=Microbacterium aurum TaxID=36805 RepID=A0A1P8U851_9MICO|nr:MULTISPECIES: hypothetical protein [Microbacterium]APZ34255.1 hypothetical protein BOH66_08370 [Microbacterium aurum]MBM7828092.1 hypothetical protein [Microbacterium aurum]